MSLYLDPQSFAVSLAPDGTLRAVIFEQQCALEVQVLRAFPISGADKDLILRDGGGKELGILENLADIEAKQRELLQNALDNRYFLPKILKIHSIFERFGSAIWRVETDRGETEINTKSLHEALYEVTPTRFMLRDVGDNRFEIPDVRLLDEASKKLFAGKV